MSMAKYKAQDSLSISKLNSLHNNANLASHVACPHLLYHGSKYDMAYQI